MTQHPCVNQKKSFLNKHIFEYLACGNSQRRIALNLSITRKTVERKFRFLGDHALEALQKGLHLDQTSKVSEIQFDDMETFEHTKLKPLSIPMVVEVRSRRILGFDVAQMPAHGRLAEKSIKKYGPRIDSRQTTRTIVLTRLKPYIVNGVNISTDKNPHYPSVIRNSLPKALHLQTFGARGCVVGQGELKNLKFDPLFWFNHTAAMLRANINRLFRKTWCTTKKSIHLKQHIAIYVWYHNEFLLRPDLKRKKLRKVLPKFALWFGYLKV